MDPLLLCELQAKAFWLALGVGLSLLGLTWQLFRRVRYLRALLELERRESSSKQRSLTESMLARLNAMQKTLLQSFLQDPTPTLSDLVESTERKFSARASRPPSAPDRTPPDDSTTINLTTKDFIPR